MTPESEAEREACTCSGEFWEDTGEHIVTVGCPQHHLMADGAPAADHETRCMCGNFADARNCTQFVNTEEDEEPVDVCAECVDYVERKQPHLARAALSTPNPEETPE